MDNSHSYNYLSGLNDKQQEAVSYMSGNVAVIAGPGTGKTHTLISRLSYLLESGVTPNSILALTFTKKAASEMRERLGRSNQLTPFVGTFHSLANSLMPQQVNIVSPKQQQAIATKKQLKQISLYKNTFVESELVSLYNTKLNELGLVDYDDLLLMLYKKLQTSSQQSRYTHILVDEFQDTNPLQYEILKLFNSQHFFVIGDPNQSIYSFRGSNEFIFDKFKNDFSPVKLITLQINYRSAPRVVETFQALFPDKQKLVASLQLQGSVDLVYTFSEYSEVDYILRVIKAAVGGLDMNEAVSSAASFSDFAIIYRSHRVGKLLEEKFRQSGVPFQVVGSKHLFEQEEIQQLLGKLVYSSEQSLSTAIKQLGNKLKISSDKIADLITIAYQFENSAEPIKDFLHYVNKLSEQEFYDPSLNQVTLLTIHAAKGLEFRTVFICGCEEGTFPLEKSAMDEEKRLFYVALSRAKFHVIITVAKQRSGLTKTASSFISLLPQKQIKVIKDTRSLKKQERIKRNKLKKSQMELF